MASRTKQKEEARARRLAEERARAERVRRDQRLRMIGGVVLAAVAIVAVLIAVSSGGGPTATGLQKGKAQSQTVASAESLLSGIPQSGVRLGNPKAPVTMTYYGDLQCPICRDFTLLGGFAQLVSSDVRSGKVQIVYKGTLTATHDPTVFQTEEEAALAAGAQNRFWDFAELFYHEQGQEGSGYVTNAYLQGLAQQIPGLNLVKWESDRNNPAFPTQVVTDEQSAHSVGVTGTPTLVFRGPTGKTAAPPEAVPTYANLQQAIKQVS